MMTTILHPHTMTIVIDLPRSELLLLEQTPAREPARLEQVTISKDGDQDSGLARLLVRLLVIWQATATKLAHNLRQLNRGLVVDYLELAAEAPGDVSRHLQQVRALQHHPTRRVVMSRPALGARAGDEDFS
jgi:hypothetical protein